jgi:hypothetical protein
MSRSIFEVSGSLTAVTAWHSVAFLTLRTSFAFVYISLQGVPSIVSMSMWDVTECSCGCSLPFTGT